MMRIDGDIITLVGNIGTMLIVMLLIDRTYRLFLEMIRRPRQPDIYGPTELRIRSSSLVSSAVGPTTPAPEGSTGWNSRTGTSRSAGRANGT